MAGPLHLRVRRRVPQGEPGKPRRATRPRVTSKAASRSRASAPRTPAATIATSAAGYVDFLLKPIDKLSLDLAGRYEDYSDFGDTTVGKLSRRATS